MEVSKMSEKKKFNLMGHLPYWVGIVIAVVMLGYTFLTGGVYSTEVENKDGCKFEVVYKTETGLIDLIEKCKLKEVGDECHIQQDVKIIKLNECAKEEALVVEEKEEVKPEEEKPELNIRPVILDKPIIKTIKLTPETVEEKPEEETKTDN
jgi:preprotein translocase subunit SecF